VTQLPEIPCVGAIVHDARGRLLVVRRANPPGRGRWSVPGGRVEPGEADRDAVVREVAEETGLQVVLVRLVGSVRRPAPGGGTFTIRDYLARLEGGTDQPIAGDDARDARWVTRAELAHLPVVDGLVEALSDWAVLPD
jgi:ADP-ribose pyrophosphatase YjhB (NUDIX family)